MAESPKQTQKKITSFTSESQNSQESLGESDYKTPKKSPKKKSKQKDVSSSEIEAANKEQNARENLTPNGEVSISSTPASAKRQPWTFEEEEMLFEKVGEYLENKEGSEEAKKKCVFLKSVEWEKVPLCGERTREEAKARFMLLSNRVRKTRTAMEILQDMKTSHKKDTGSSTVSRKRKAPVDPDLPKKPITSYMLFYQAKKSKLLEKHPELSVIEISQKLGKRWRNLSDEKKQKYSDQWHNDMEDYNHKMMKYLKNHHPDVEPPLTAFDLWAEEESKQIKSDKPEISDRKLKKKLNRRWENLEESEKSKWTDKEKKEMKKYKKRIVLAEKKAKTEV